MSNIDLLILCVDRYAAAKGLSPLTVSRLFFGSSGRIDQLRDGGDMGVLTSSRALEQFASEWPASVPMPDGLSDFIPGGSSLAWGLTATACAEPAAGGGDSSSPGEAGT